MWSSECWVRARTKQAQPCCPGAHTDGGAEADSTALRGSKLHSSLEGLCQRRGAGSSGLWGLWGQRQPPWAWGGACRVAGQTGANPSRRGVSRVPGRPGVGGRTATEGRPEGGPGTSVGGNHSSCEHLCSYPATEPRGWCLRVTG